MDNVPERTHELARDAQSPLVELNLKQQARPRKEPIRWLNHNRLQVVKNNADQFRLVSCTFRQRLTTRLLALPIKKEMSSHKVVLAQPASVEAMKSVDVFVRGVGLGRDAAIRALGSYDISIDSIKEVTGVPHGGVRPRKARRG